MYERINTLELRVQKHDKRLESLNEYLTKSNKEIKKLKWYVECKPIVYECFLMWKKCVLKEWNFTENLRNALNNILLEINDDFLTIEKEYFELCDKPNDLSTIRTFREMVKAFRRTLLN